MEDIRARLKSEHPLPPLPAVAQRLLELLNADAPFDDIATVLATDAAMATRVLRVANSVAMRGASPIASLPEAFLRIGTTQLRQMILSLVFVHHFPRRGAFDYVAFWRHSLHVAIATQLLERYAAGRETALPEAYTAGLLHDIGIPYLNLNAPTLYRQVIVEARASADPLTDVEQRMLGVDHEEAAAFLLTEWSFPPVVVAACRHGHHPATSGDVGRGLVRLVHTADRLVWGLGFDNGTKRVCAEFSPAALADVDIDPERHEMIVTELQTLARQVESCLI